MNDSKIHKVVKINHSDSGIFELILERNEIYFEPGDCVAIYSDKKKSRPYSISSGINDKFISFLIRTVKNGEVSEYLSKLKKNHEVRISEPFGWFKPIKCSKNEKNVFLATGTGIAPFLSYLKSYPTEPPHALFYGIRKQEDLFELNTLKKIKNLYISISQENSKFHKGRITDLLSSIPLSKNNYYYCCGRESMINDVRLFLKGKGIKNNKIFNEVFFNG
mgnify:CR=1 FL=1